MPPCDVEFNFVFRHWAAAHGVVLHVGNKLLLLFLLTLSVLVGNFFQDLERKKRFFMILQSHKSL